MDDRRLQKLKKCLITVYATLLTLTIISSEYAWLHFSAATIIRRPIQTCSHVQSKEIILKLKNFVTVITYLFNIVKHKGMPNII